MKLLLMEHAKIKISQIVENDCVMRLPVKQTQPIREMLKVAYLEKQWILKERARIFSFAGSGGSQDHQKRIAIKLRCEESKPN